MINFIIKDRQEGKTTEMLKWVRQDALHVLVVHSAGEVDRLIRQEGLHKTQVVSVEQVKNGILRGKKGITLGLDNLDILLQHFFGGVHEIQIVAATGIAIDGVMEKG